MKGVVPPQAHTFDPKALSKAVKEGVWCPWLEYMNFRKVALTLCQTEKTKLNTYKKRGVNYSNLVLGKLRPYDHKYVLVLKTVLFTRFGLQKVHNKMLKTGVFQGHYSKSGEFQTEASRSSVDGRKRSFSKTLKAQLLRYNIYLQTEGIREYHANSSAEVQTKLREMFTRPKKALMRVSIPNPNMADEFFSHLLFPLNCSKATLAVASVNTCER